MRNPFVNARQLIVDSEQRKQAMLDRVRVLRGRSNAAMFEPSFRELAAVDATNRLLAHRAHRRGE